MVKRFLQISTIIIPLFFIILFYRSAFAELDKTIQSTIIASIGTVLASVGAVIYNQRRAKEREISESHRPMKIEVYKNFMQMMFEFLGSSKAPKPDQIKSMRNLEKGFVVFTREIIAWGSPEVIRVYSQFRNSAIDKQNYELLLIFDELLREMRSDLGNSNKRIKKGDLIKLFLTDPEKLDVLLK